MMFESIGRIVGCAEQNDSAPHKQVAARKGSVGQPFGGDPPHTVGRVRPQEAVVYSEIPGKFEVSPVIELIFHEARNSRSPLLELLAVGSVSRAEAFRNAVRAHGAPFVVVAVKPYLGDVGPPLIVRNLGGRQVAVIVNDRHVFGIFVVKLAGERRLQKKFIRDKTFHGSQFSFLIRLSGKLPASGFSLKLRVA